MSPPAYRVLIPARIGATRLPGKPLVVVAGRTMIEWVIGQARASAAQDVIVATDDDEIERVARAAGTTVVRTRAEHVSGTDRLAEAVDTLGLAGSDLVVNLQADEPRMPPVIIDQVATLLAAHADAAIATAAAPLASIAEYHDRNIVKVVTDLAGRALYFSRAPIPCERDASMAADDSAVPLYARRHIGIYAYQCAALREFAALPPSPLEQLERLEQLRALEHGLGIRVVDAAAAPGRDVNTPADLLELARELEGGVR